MFHRVQMFDGPELEVNSASVAVIAPAGGGQLVGTCMLVFATPVLTPTVVRANMDELGRLFGFRRVEALNGTLAYVNPDAVAQVMPRTEPENPKDPKSPSRTILGQSIIIFASANVMPTGVKGGPAAVALQLSSDAGPALVTL